MIILYFLIILICILDLVTEESVLFLAITFVVMFVQVGMEALITPLTKVYFDWGEVENSVFYSVQGILVRFRRNCLELDAERFVIRRRTR